MELKKASLMGLLYDIVFAYVLTNFGGYASEFVYGNLPFMALVTTLFGALALAGIWMDQTFLVQRFHRDDKMVTLIFTSAGIVTAGLVSRHQSGLWIDQFDMFARYLALMSAFVLVQYIAAYITADGQDRKLLTVYIIGDVLRTLALLGSSFLGLVPGTLLALAGVECAHLLPLGMRDYLTITKDDVSHMNQKMAILLIMMIVKKMIFDLVIYFLGTSVLSLPQLGLRVVFLGAIAVWTMLHFDTLMNDRRELKGASLICTYILVIACTVILTTGIDILTEPLTEPLYAVSVFYLCVAVFDISLILGVRHYRLSVRHRTTVITGIVVLYLLGLFLSLRFLALPTIVLAISAVMAVGKVLFSMEASQHKID